MRRRITSLSKERMTSIFTTTKARIWGTTNSWSLSQFAGSDQPKSECLVELEIQGDDHDGYNLVMRPSGFFTADTWHRTKDDALLEALELFGVARDAWSNNRSPNKA